MIKDILAVHFFPNCIRLSLLVKSSFPLKPVILTFARYYLPGYRAGGPIQTIANAVEQLGDEFDFRIITTDRDIGDSVGYPNVLTNTWVKVGNANVYYMTPGESSFRQFAQLMNETPHDVQYLNSFFDPSFTIKPLLVHWMGLATRKPLVIAPRGELSHGALALKRWKKRLYLAVFNQLNTINYITWQASSEREAADILRALNKGKSNTQKNYVKIAPDFVQALPVNAMGPDFRLHLAPNLPGRNDSLATAEMRLPRLVGQTLRVCFLSRIAPMKNLDYALRVLAQVREPVRFSIYGPQEDSSYWLECLQLISALPSNITVEVLGSVAHQNVMSILAKYDLFFLPTRGENFGHVIHEALRAGTPALISDQTPWRDLEEYAVGWSLPLAIPSSFVRVIEEVACWDDDKARAATERALAYANKVSSCPNVRKANIEIFKNSIAINIENN